MKIFRQLLLNMLAMILFFLQQCGVALALL